MEESAVERLILVVEHNLDHLRQIERALSESPVCHRIVAMSNGKEAMAYLHRQGDHAAAPRPDLLLLDLDLPEKDGRDVLAEIKADAQLRRIPIVVLTFSATEADILRSYTLQGNCYVIKSSDLDQLFRLVKRIEEFWLGIVTLPLE